jgi:Predicted transcriptional regulators
MKAHIDISLSELISIHRTRLHLNQSELAKVAGVSRNYISLIERGHIENVSLGVLKRICDKLGLKVEVSYETEIRV